MKQDLKQGLLNGNESLYVWMVNTNMNNTKKKSGLYSWKIFHWKTPIDKRKIKRVSQLEVIYCSIIEYCIVLRLTNE